MPPSLHFIPNRPNVTIKFYETLLTTTQSVLIEHFTRPNSDEIAYSKLKIQKVLSSAEWTQQLSVQQSPFIYQAMTLVTDRHPVQVNYKYYIDAWRNIIFYKDSSSGHSWYVTLKKSLKVNLPAWFMAEWWTKFGPHIGFFPNEVFKKYEAEKLSLFQFMHKHSIPWILKWQYGTHKITIVHNITYTYLSQEIQCKWWDKFDIESIDISIVPPTPIKSTENRRSFHPTEFSRPQEFPPLTKTYKDVSLASPSRKNPISESSSSINSDLAQTIIQQLQDGFQQNFQQGFQNIQNQIEERFEQFESKYSASSKTHSEDNSYSAHSADSIDL
ncbi:hypothetical protein Scep_019431 [Stephania cephalantha]|uniref:Uncharacterized protein n=1 Tax=Stephania cephalantha TaxID=152367 RepID=A0AAP0IB14_9MAGN